VFAYEGQSHARNIRALQAELDPVGTPRSCSASVSARAAHAHKGILELPPGHQLVAENGPA